MPNPWSILEATLEKAQRQRDESIKNWEQDRCPICYGLAIYCYGMTIGANIRVCSEDHAWRRDEDTGAYLIPEGLGLPLDPVVKYYPDYLFVHPKYSR